MAFRVAFLHVVTIFGSIALPLKVPERQRFWQNCLKPRFYFKRDSNRISVHSWHENSISPGKEATQKRFVRTKRVNVRSRRPVHQLSDRIYSPLGTEMSMYFFRLHNLRRQAEEVRKKRQKGRSSQSGQRGTNSTDQSQPTAGSMHCCNRVHRGPSKLFERAPLQPSDSLDEIAFQIPR